MRRRSFRCSFESHEQPMPVQLLAEDAGIVTWWGTRIECTSAVARLERAACLTSRQASQAIEVLRALAAGWNEILPAESVRETACRLLRVHSLRAADALQLAAATVMAGGRVAHAEFLAFDDRLREAAGREGFRVRP